LIPSLPTRANRTWVTAPNLGLQTPPPPPGSVAALSNSNTADAADPLRTFTFYLALALVFIKFAMLQEIQTRAMGFNGHLLYIFGVPAILGVILAGGLRRAFDGRPAFYWLAYGVWLAIGIPFSSWRGGSLPALWDVWRTSLIMVPVIAGLVVSWRECRLVAWAIALACVVNLMSARIFQGDTYDYRLGLEFGTIANPNLFAGHLVLVLPFVLWVVLAAKSVGLRVAALVVLGMGVYVALQTASRGALLALVAEAFLFFLCGTVYRRVALICIAPVALAALLTALPESVLQRISSFSATEGKASLEALESSHSRSYLLRKSIEYALKFPLFGVGLEQFASYEGGHNIVIGTHGSWHATHNSYTQAASECGIPAFILLLAAWISSFRLMLITHRRARRRADCRDIEALSFCMMLAILGFCVAITFLNFAYAFYGPAMGGFSISVWRAAKGEFEKRTLAAQPV